MALHRLRSLTIGVPDVASAVDFYTEFGLVVDGVDDAPDGAATAAFATRDGGRQLVMRRAPWRRLEAIDVGADDDDDLARIEHALAALGVASRRTDAGLEADEPHAGVTVTVRVEPRVDPHRAATDPVNSPGAIERTNRPADVVLRADGVRPAVLSHAVLGTPNYDATMAFFCDGLGFQVSDAVPGVIAFTRCSEVHHNIAIQATPGRLLHHVAFEVDHVDEVLRGGSHMVELAAEHHVWGLGRHAIGSNWFWYLRDPAGNYVEYTADIDRITAQDLYVPKQWDGKEFLYAYGPAVPEAFLAPADAGEIFALQAS
jgi:catechol 2,3-dioxygenase-like lactoylglutathione lyase family enzyme